MSSAAAYFIISKSIFISLGKNGFTKGCMNKAAEMGNITLVAYNEMLKTYPR